MSIHKAKQEHEVAYADLIVLLNKHAAKLTAFELLAVAANLVGKLVAMQDQRLITPQLAMETVAQNLEVGNQQVIEELSKSMGTA